MKEINNRGSERLLAEIRIALNTSLIRILWI